MNGPDLVKEYRSKTDDELVRLWQDQAQLMPGASTCLAEEMARRQIGDFQRPSAFNEQPVPVQETFADWKSAGMQHAAGTAAAPYPGMPVPIAGASKPPWTPNTVGVIAFFFGPLAGALISSISLRRMGYPDKARKALLVGLFGVFGLAVILFFTPDRFARLLGLSCDIAFVLGFRRFQEVEFARWRDATAGAEPDSGWKAVGWGLIGMVLFFLIALAAFLGLAVFFQPA